MAGSSRNLRRSCAQRLTKARRWTTIMCDTRRSENSPFTTVGYKRSSLTYSLTYFVQGHTNSFEVKIPIFDTNSNYGLCSAKLWTMELAMNNSSQCTQLSEFPKVNTPIRHNTFLRRRFGRDCVSLTFIFYIFQLVNLLTPQRG